MKDNGRFKHNMLLTSHKMQPPKKVAMVANMLDKMAMFSKKHGIPIWMGGEIDISGS